MVSQTGEAADGAPDAPLRPFRCGHVTLAGQPNAGKSTLLNRLVGEKLAITSPKPQTTRDVIRGIVTTPDTQAIFVDTPGIHRARSPLNRAMVGQAIEALEQVDVVVLVVDAQVAAKWAEKVGGKHRPPTAEAQPAPVAVEDDDEAGDEEAETEAELPSLALDPRIPPGDRRVIRNILRYNDRWLVALNKVDVVKPTRLLSVMQAYGAAPQVGAIVPVSAWTGDGVAQLLEAIRGYLPEAEPEYGADELTDRSLKFLCAELVREQVFLQTREEVPYGVMCEIEAFTEHEDLTHVQALVHVEKDAQRAILIGKGGARMKALATAARLQMERLLQRKVFLEVHVHVEPSWSTRVEKLKEYGYLL